MDILDCALEIPCRIISVPRSIRGGAVLVHLVSTSSRCALKGVVQQLSSTSTRCARRALKGVVQQLYTRKFSEASIVSSRWLRLQK